RRGDERAGSVAAVVDTPDPSRELADAANNVIDVPINDGLAANRSLTSRERVGTNDLVEPLDFLSMQRVLADGQLEPVVLRRIVRSGNLDAANDVEMMETPIIQGRRDDANVDDVGAGAGEAIDQRVAQRGATRPVVAANRN